MSARKKRVRSTTNAAEPPHSWGISDWPPHVWPNTPSRGRYLVRAQRDELLRHGVLVRVGRDLVINGRAFDRWLQLQASEVVGYECNANANRERGAE